MPQWSQILRKGINYGNVVRLPARSEYYSISCKSFPSTTLQFSHPAQVTLVFIFIKKKVMLTPTSECAAT